MEIQKAYFMQGDLNGCQTGDDVITLLIDGEYYEFYLLSKAVARVDYWLYKSTELPINEGLELIFNRMGPTAIKENIDEFFKREKCDSF